MDALARDLRHALRRLARSPGFAVAAVAILGVGLGAGAAVFGVVNGLFLRPLPGVSGTERLVTLHPSAASSVPTLTYLRETATTLSGVAGYVDELLSVDVGSRAERRLGLLVSEEYFRVLGVRPAAGRLPGPEVAGEDPRVAVIGHALWKRRFGGDPDAVGRTLTLNGEPFRVVGVAPVGFVGAVAGFRFDVWVPLAAAPYVAPALDLDDPALDRLELVARLADGATLERARQELRRLAAGLRATRSELPSDLEIGALAFTGFDEDLRGPVQTLLLALGGIAALLLLIAVTNVVGMLVVRGVGRSREIAVRRALGGGARRSVRPLFLEGVALALAGGVVALGVAEGAGRLLRAAMASFPVELVLPFGLDLRLGAFVLALALGTGLVVGALPAVRAGEGDLRAALAGGRGEAGARDASRLRRALVVAQIAGSALLLVVAAAFTQAVRETARAETGFRADSVQVAPFLDPRLAGIADDEAGAFYERLLETVRGSPGVASAAVSTAVPLDFTGPATRLVRVEGVPPPPGADGFEVDGATVSAGYFESLGVRLLRGRDFRPTDEERDEPAAIASAALAARFWPDGEALGRRLLVDGRLHRIVGVAPDLRYRPLAGAPAPFVYTAVRDRPPPRAALLVRSVRPAGPLADALRSAIRRVAPSLPLELQSLASFQRIALLPQRLVAGTGGLLGGLGLGLAGLGVYSVVAFWVIRRRREIGIRVAVGARSRDVVRLVLEEGLKLAAVGLALGGLLAWLALRLLAGLSAGLSSAGVSLAAAAALATVLVTAVAGGAIPALRALRVDPVDALRAE